MKKIFTFMAAALFAAGASAQIANPVSAKLTWALTDGTTASVATPSGAGEGTLTVGAGLEIIEAAKPFNGINFMAFQATNEDKGDNKYDKAVELEKYIDFTFAPSDQFSMTNVSFDIVKVGTGDPQIFVDIIDGEGVVTHVKDGAAIDIRRNDDTTNPEVDITQTYEVTTPASDKAVTLRIYVGKLANNKQVGLANVVIEGTINGDNLGGDEGGNEGGEVVEGVRRWDFTNWSEATIANLIADAAASTGTGWSDVEKKADADADGEPTATSKDNCFWAADASIANADLELQANGVVIEELKGLKFTGDLTSRNLAIAVNYPTAYVQTDEVYEGPAYLWLGGSNKNFFTIPAVEGGSVIKMGVESHAPNHSSTPARGVELKVNGEVIEGPAVPTTYEDQKWTIPAGETVDVVVNNTNGCHIYYIEVVSPTGVQKITVNTVNNGAIYNLAGQKVNENYKGIVIQNGKKFMQK